MTCKLVWIKRTVLFLVVIPIIYKGFFHEKFTAFIKTWEHGRSSLKERIVLENSRIKQVCQKYYIETSSMANDRPSFENVGNFYANVDQNLGWCLIPKVGSSTMKALIMNTSGKFTKEAMGSLSMEKNNAALHLYVNDKFILPKEVIESPFPVKSLHQLIVKNSMFTFSFVRHPHSRLVSAYEDKILGLSKNREVITYLANRTFPEFIDHVILKGKTGHGINEHWKPAYMHCNFCQIDYNVVGRIEKFEEYLGYIVENTNLSTRISGSNFSTMHIHSSGIHTISPTEYEWNKKLKVKKYFSSLSKQQMTDLHDIYKIDFELFDYDFEEYFR